MFRKLVLSCTLIAASGLQAVDIIKEHKAVSRIYVEAFAEEKQDSTVKKTPVNIPFARQGEKILMTAVADLNYHLRKMSGAELEVIRVSDVSGIKAPAIVIGAPANTLGAKPKGTSELGETFRIRTQDGMILIGGESPLGCAYGIYELLSILGCDWVMPGVNGEIIPERADVSISELDIEQSPSFSVRCPWYSGGASVITQKCREEFDQWKLRQKEQLDRQWHPLMMSGGHVWGTLISKYAEEFKKNPEMLAMVRLPDGTMKRKGPQIETTNSKVIALFADYIREMFRKNGWANDKNICIGVGPSDGGGFSESPESTIAGANRIDPISGDPDITDLQILLCNQLIEKLEGEFPNLRLGFYLYNTHADYPMKYTPNRKVTIVLADITYSRLHGIGDRSSKTRAYYKDILEQWGNLSGRQGNNIFFRGYNWNLAENFLPYTKLKIWGEDIPYYKKMGVIGFYNEYSKAWSVLGPSDYLEAKLIWNASLDWKEVLSKYCRNAFGKGAPFIEKYYLMLADRQSRSGYEAGSYHSFGLMYDDNFVKESLALFAQAEKAAEKDSEKMRVRFAAAPAEMLKHYLTFRKAYSSFDFVSAKKTFEQMKSELKQYEETDPNLICRNAVKYLDRFYGKFMDESVKYSTGDYRVIFPLPDRLKTVFDSGNCGQTMNYFGTEINDMDYISTATYSSTWDAQGLMGYRSGSVWYRIPVELSDKLKNEPVGLFVGGADSIVRIWLNGEYAGMGQGFARPFQFDLTGLCRTGGNLIVIQVQRYGNSEIGTGGLIYPSFLFTGPRLANKAPKTEKLERVLPGGERESAKE